MLKRTLARMLLLLAFCASGNIAMAQHTRITPDGHISPTEFGIHENGQNKMGNWLITWDANNLYIGVTQTNTEEAAILYLDTDPIVPINGGTNEHGSNVGHAFDGTNFSVLPFRANHILYFKQSGRQLLTSNGANGWNVVKNNVGEYHESNADTREISIAWSELGSMPAAFNFFGFVTSSAGVVHDVVPAKNTAGSIGINARFQHYFTVRSTVASSPINKPFAYESFVFNSDNNIQLSDAFSFWDFTINEDSKTCTIANADANQVVAGTLNVADGNLLLEQNTTLHIAGNLIQDEGDILTQAGTSAHIIFDKQSGLQTISQNDGDFIGNISLSVGNGNTNNIVQLLSDVDAGNANVQVLANAGVDFQEYALQGSGSFSALQNSLLITSNTDGINGSLHTSGQLLLSDAVHYTFNGNEVQETGSMMGMMAGTLTIQNPTQVTLTNSHTTVSKLILNNGLFAAGLHGFLNIADAGTIVGNGGAQPNNATAGIISFLGNGSTSGTVSTGSPVLYEVHLNGAVDFNGSANSSNARILHQLQINVGGICLNDAPIYDEGSTLVYNAGPTLYNRGEEWSSNVPNTEGYPWHVKVYGGTTVSLATNMIETEVLQNGGNLVIGNSTSDGTGFMVMENNANKKPLRILGNLLVGNGCSDASTLTVNSPLTVFGNLTIGSGLAEDKLTLGANAGDDLYLHGNFDRFENAIYDDRTRAIHFVGSTTSIVNNTALLPPATNFPVSQYFSNMVVHKQSGAEYVNIKTPTGITGKLTILKGIVSTQSHELYITNPLPDDATNGIAGGNDQGFIEGKLYRYTAQNQLGTYSFPVGKNNVYRPMQLTTSNANNSISLFSTEFYEGTEITRSLQEDFFEAPLQAILRNEYWQVERPLGFASGMIGLYYANPGVGNYWRNAEGTTISPCNTCGVAVTQRNAELAGNGTWGFTKEIADFVTVGPNQNIRLHSENGFVMSGELNSFSPFSLGLDFGNVLGALPVHMLAWDGKIQANDAHLQWSIDSDKDLLSFEVQHSTNGVQFATVGHKLPAGKSYSFVHQNLSSGKHYYRLLVKEKSGNFYSKIIVLVVGQANSFIVGLQSNVVKQQVVANIWSAKSQTAEAIITDVSGRLISKQSSQLVQGQNQLNVPVALLSKGIYHITIFTNDGIKQTLRWMKE